MKKEILLFILALLPVMASADDSGSCGKNVTYTYVEATRTLTISGEGAMDNYNYGYTPTPWRNYRHKILIVNIENGVTSIGDLAFGDGCLSLTTVNISNSVTSIGWCAFQNCYALTSIAIPKSVTSIDRTSFVRCGALNSIVVESGNPKFDSRDNCNALIETATNTLIKGSNNTFIPNSVTTIFDEAFAKCSSLTSITIPSSVISIGGAAFSYCSNLNSISVESGNPVYDSRDNCNAIIETASNTLIVGGTTNTVIPNTVTAIGGSAFKGRENLTSISIPDGITSIGGSAFYYCTSLASVTIPNSVTSIEDMAFGCCYRLASLNIPNGVKYIGRLAFWDCTGLTAVSIPSSVIFVGENVFKNCSKLNTIEVYIGKPLNIDASTFDGVDINNCVLYVPKGCAENYRSVDVWKDFKNIEEMDFDPPTPEGLLLNEENFPDANFRAALAEEFGISEGDEITEEKIAATTTLNVSSKQIANLTGIEHFTALTELDCYDNQLTALDVSKNTALKYLSCDGNQLTALDVSNNTALIWLYCYYNQLTALDVSNNTALTYLDCDVNQLTSLDVSKNTALTELYCSNNQLTSLDVSKNTALTDLSCRSNQLTSLDVSKNAALEWLYCFGNQIKGEAMDALVASLPTVENGEFYVINTKDTNEGNVCTKSQVAVAKGKGWTVYDYNGSYSNRQEYEGSDDAESSCPDNNHPHMIDLGLPSGTKWACCNVGASVPYEHGGYYAWGETEEKEGYYTWDTYSHCDGSEETCHDIGSDIAGTEFDVAHVKWGGSWQIPSGEIMNELISNCTSKWTTLNGTNGVKFTGTSGASIFMPVTGFKWRQLQDAESGYYRTSTLSSEMSWAFIYYFKSDKLTGPVGLRQRDDGEAVRPVVVKSQATGLLLNAENFPDANFRAALASILGISEGDEITEAKIAATTSIDVSKSWNTPAEEKIADLTGIEHFTALTKLSCYNNQLTSLDVSQNTALISLSCDNNQLTALDVSQNTALISLPCYNNQLTALDVSKNTELKYLYCFNNQLTSLDVSQNIALTYLHCYNNQLTSLDVSKNTALTSLDCFNNQLTSLDVSGCTALTSLNCFSNKLTSLNVPGCIALTSLCCDENLLTSLDVSKNTALTELYCNNNQLTSLDISKNTALTELYCYNNQLTSLDVSKNTALKLLYCYNNQLTSLDVSKNIALKWLYCYNNQLTSLDVSKNTALKNLYCYSNQIEGAAMDALVENLPVVENGYFSVINTNDENEGNVCTKAQVAVAKEKGWKVYDYNGYREYEGSDPVEEDIDPVDEDDNIDFGNDMDENSDLDGNVIGDIFYNINTGNGGYDAAEGCIVLKKTTSDETVDGLSGKDIFGEDFKGQFTGIVFKVPAGKGTVKVTAETTGNMLLKVKIGDGKPVKMEFNGKLKISFPYNVSETTFVAIYAGANNEAKGFGTTNDAEDAALKIYGIEFERDNTTAIGASLNDNGKMINDNYYSIDGKKLQGEPTKKGIYIYKGKKVKK